MNCHICILRFDTIFYMCAVEELNADVPSRLM